jgi:hypothetical protein
MMYNNIDPEILRLIPPINRARDYRLYTQDGRRVVDLWQYGGRAILGHNPPGVLRELKNSAERGLFAPLPHPRDKRLDRALAALFPGRVFRIRADEASLRRSLAAANFPAPDNFPDPAISAEDAFDGSAPALWRPFLTTPLFTGHNGGSDAGTIQEKLSRCPILIPVLPLPWPCAPWVLALDAGIADRFPPSDLISPPVLAAAARSVLALVAAITKREKTPVFQKKILPCESKWQVRGVYLYYKEVPAGLSWPFSLPDSGTSGILRRGFLPPPTRQDPVILPGLLSPGEEAKLAELLGANDYH